MPRRYQNPPIVEALCDFRFRPTADWDLTIPGLFYERVKDLFPEKRQQPHSLQLRIEGSPRGLVPDFAVESRLQFLSLDNAELFQVGKDLLTANRLKPYTSWEEFLPTIRLGYETYCDVANPSGLQRIGLRYINLIPIHSDLAELSEFFNLHPAVGQGLPRSFYGFSLATEFSYPNSPDHLRVLLTSTQLSSPTDAEVVLDLDYFLPDAESIPIGDVFNWVESAHTQVENSFESIITDRLRYLFQLIGG